MCKFVWHAVLCRGVSGVHHIHTPYHHLSPPPRYLNHVPRFKELCSGSVATFQSTTSGVGRGVASFREKVAPLTDRVTVAVVAARERLETANTKLLARCDQEDQRVTRALCGRLRAQCRAVLADAAAAVERAREERGAWLHGVLSDDALLAGDASVRLPRELVFMFSQAKKHGRVHRMGGLPSILIQLGAKGPSVVFGKG